MTGMDVVIELRRGGRKPAAVFVGLMDKAQHDPYAMYDPSIVSVDIGRSDHLADIDFRPLVGLRVHMHDFADNSARYRKAAAMVAAIEPAHLVMYVIDGETLTVHQRWAGSPARTETISI